MEYSSPRLDQEEKDSFFFYHQLGFSYNDIIDEFYIQFKRNLTKGTISKIINKFNATEMLRTVMHFISISKYAYSIFIITNPFSKYFYCKKHF